MGWKRLGQSGAVEGGAQCASGKEDEWQGNGLGLPASPAFQGLKRGW